MPIPVLTDYFSAQVIFKNQNGNPKDVYTNTFYFRNDTFVGTTDDVATDLLADLQEFYTAQPTGVLTPVTVLSRFSNLLLDLEVEVRVYDLGLPAPRYPRLRNFTATGMHSGAIPAEVAACLSYVAAENQPRNRGRIYLGPLSTNAVNAGNGNTAVDENWRRSVLASAKRLMDKPEYTWSLWSPTSQEMKPITGAWMDNAFDTQRRRGEEADVRHYMGEYLGRSGIAYDAA